MIWLAVVEAALTVIAVIEVVAVETVVVVVVVSNLPMKSSS